MSAARPENPHSNKFPGCADVDSVGNTVGIIGLSSGSQARLHVRLSWGAFQNDPCPAPGGLRACISLVWAETQY